MPTLSTAHLADEPDVPALAGVSDVLQKTFTSLDNKAIRYALLRDFETLAIHENQKEIDLLVHPDDFTEFSCQAMDLGYVKLLGMGYRPHHFFAKFDALANTLVKLDVVTDLFYGKPHRTLLWPTGAAFLSRRVQMQVGYVLSPGDELISLFLHCLLDKNHLRELRRARLQHLLAEVEARADMLDLAKRNLEIALHKSLEWNQFRELINNNTTPLTGVIPVVEKALFRLAPLSNTFRKIAVPVQRKLRPLGFAMGHRGIWVALLAPDGGGKSTLSGKLINQPLLRAKSIYMGINVDASTVGFPTTKKLKQAVKSLEANKEKRKMLAVVKAAASINKLLEHWYRLALGLLYSFNGRTVIFDRFVYDGYINARPKRLKSRLRHLLLWGVCPDADLTVYLDAPGEVLFRRKGEHSPEVLETQRRKYHGLQGQIPNFHVVDATQTPEEVLREVMQLIWLTLQQLSKR